MGEPEDGAAIVVFASGPSNDLIERQLIQDHVVSSGRILKSANREDPPIRDERVVSTPSDHTFSWFERCVQEGLSIGEPLAPPCDGARSAWRRVTRLRPSPGSGCTGSRMWRG